MRILLTGGCGYVGSVLTQELLNRGYEVIVVDIMWFGNFLQQHKNLKIIEEDIRNYKNISFDCIDAVIHLANVANDPCVDLDPVLSWEVNVLGTMKLVEKAIKSKVKQFIYASSGSVYGIKEEEKVTEDLDLEPISVYNKTKMVAERVLLSFKDDILIQCVRPGTVCGVSPRMRLDLMVNMLTVQALVRGEITVLGGNQYRPNININDMISVYLFLLEKGKAAAGIFNTAFENLKVSDVATLITKHIPAKIIIKESNDPRSYRMCSDRLLNVGFRPSYNVEKAIAEIKDAYKAGKLHDEEKWYNIRWMKKNPPVKIY